jgi:amidase
MFTLSRRDVLAASAGFLAAARASAAPTIDVVEKSLSELGTLLAQGATTSKALVQAYLARIEQLDRAGPMLRSVIETNPDALMLAEALDTERTSKKLRGPLHGLPVLVKDNLDTADKMKTTAGSLALLDAPTPARDAFVVQRLRDAGAIILGKTNLSEWANLRGRSSVSGWSARGGQTRNPYVLQRNPSGSSSGSGVAVAASLCAAAIGTETDGSIVSPACSNGVVGLKPTLGLVSRSGIIPLSHTQDTAGPMTRTVRDAALMLDAIAAADPSDPATLVRHQSTPYAAALDGASLKGRKLGLVKNLVNAHRGVGDLTRKAVNVLRNAGATIVEVEVKTDAYNAAESDVLLFELKADLNAYLARRGGPKIGRASCRERVS